MPPADAVDPGVSFDIALEVDVDAFPDRAGVQVAAQLQDHQRHIWIILTIIMRKKRDEYHVTTVDSSDILDGWCQNKKVKA